AAAAREAEVVRVERRARAGDEGLELLDVRGIKRVDGAEREGEPVREEAVALAEPLDRRGEVAAAAHVVLGRDFEEGHSFQHVPFVHALEHVVEELPAKPEADADHARLPAQPQGPPPQPAWPAFLSPAFFVAPTFFAGAVAGLALVAGAVTAAADVAGAAAGSGEAILLASLGASVVAPAVAPSLLLSV